MRQCVLIPYYCCVLKISVPCQVKGEGISGGQVYGFKAYGKRRFNLMLSATEVLGNPNNRKERLTCVYAGICSLFLAIVFESS